MPTANVFKPYVAGIKTDLEARLHQELLRRFNGLEPQERPWYGAGLALQGGTITKGLNFVIVPPTHVILAHVFGAPGGMAGILHGSQTAKEWWLETADARVLKIGDEVSPFAQAKATLHLFLPKLDSFLHSRKVKNPYVHSILVFPDDFSFTGVQDIPVGPTARGAVTVVKLSEVWQAALSHSQGLKLDPAVFGAWLKTLFPTGAESSFRYTWIDPSPAPTPEPVVERTAASEASLTVPSFSQDENDVITLSQEAPWSLGERSEEFTLPEKEEIEPSRGREGRQKRPTIVGRLLKLTAAGVLVLLILFIGHEVYMYLTPTFPSTPYWQGTTPAEPEPQSGELKSGQTQSQDVAEPAPPSTTIPNAPNRPPPKITDLPSAPQAQAETPTPVVSLPAPAANRPDTLAPTSIPVKPAAAGTYETVRPTVAFDQPKDSGPVIDQIRAGTKLNVIGSDGDWLIVRSRARNATVYIRRGDAMLMSDPATQPRSMERIEQRWKEIELQIQEAILRRGIPNVNVSFIGDTAYLRGNVRTPDDSYKAELAAKTIPDVKYVHNGIWVKR